MACLRDDLKPVILGRPTGVANVVIGVSFEFRRRRYDFVFSQRQLYTMHLTTHKIEQIMSESTEPLAQPATTTETALTTTTPATGAMGSTLGNRYGSSMGMGMGSRYGMGGMGMGSSYGMGGMGMGMGGMGMGRMGMMGGRGMNNPNSQQLNQHSQQMFHGMRSMIQMGFATFGVFTYGKLFLEMVKNAMGWTYNTVIWIFKKFLSTFVFNNITTKILNGIVNRNSSAGPSGAGPDSNSPYGLFFRGLMTAGLMALGWVWFMYKQSNMSEYEHLLEERLKKRKIEREQKMREFDERKNPPLTQNIYLTYFRIPKSIGSGTT